MKKYWNRLKYWLFVRRHHIDGIRFETVNPDVLEVYVEVDGKRVSIALLGLNAPISEGVTDYGIALAARRLLARAT